MVAHRAAYDTRSATASSALVNWRQRALWPTLNSLKLRAGLAGCRDRDEPREPHAGAVGCVRRLFEPSRYRPRLSLNTERSKVRSCTE